MSNRAMPSDRFVVESYTIGISLHIASTVGVITRQAEYLRPKSSESQ
jgi:hypothetical protein